MLVCRIRVILFKDVASQISRLSHELSALHARRDLMRAAETQALAELRSRIEGLDNSVCMILAESESTLVVDVDAAFTGKYWHHISSAMASIARAAATPLDQPE